jgi:polysaccharide export outer membrane protein
MIGSDTIAPGDKLTITVWENVDQGVLAAAGGGATSLPVQVDGQGFIFMPYAGRIRAAGNSPEALRQVITRQLETQTPDPQVLVARDAGDGTTVSIVGNVGGQGIYPIERPTRTLTAMLARAGGISAEPEGTQITVIRDGQRGTVWLSDLYADPSNDIALRPGDRILVEQDTRAYTAIGATGGQRRVTFDTQDLSALEAITQAGGLNSNIADPTGIFIFRDEPAEIANAVLGRHDLTGKVRMIYVLDLTKPSGIFVARDFVIRDEDTIYVTEAPFTQWQKIIGSITGAANSANSLNNVANGFNN